VTGKEDKGDQRGVTEKDDGQISSRRCDQLYTWKTLYPMFTEKLPNVLHVNVFVDILWLVDKGYQGCESHALPEPEMYDMLFQGA
jgi:hypothetical protein